MDRWALAIGPALIVALVVWLTGWTGGDQPSLAGPAMWVLITSLPWAIGWLAAAIGLGWPLRRWLLPAVREGLAIQIGLGIAAMLMLNAGLGALGVLQIGGAAGAWALLIFGWFLLGAQMLASSVHSRGPTNIQHPTAKLRMLPPPWLIWTSAPAVAVLIAAACSAPGWLWASEFGGYDALSYHLQLPKEWLALGRIEPLHHNVYSFLPGFMEAAYYHLAVLIGDGVNAVYACQMLHALMTIVAAGLIARLCGSGLVRAEVSLSDPVIGAIAFVLVLGTPWAIVVGSLAYNEMTVVVLLAAGLLVLAEDVEANAISSWRVGATVGMLAAAACGAKLTAVGLAAAPLGVGLLLRLPPRRWIGAVGAGFGAGAIVLAPYLIRNQIFVGNPLFPFATSIFGLGHWSAEQAAIWTTGHQASVGAGERFASLWNEFLRYGIGPNPNPTEPWKAQWLILPWLGIIGIGLAMRSPKLRRQAKLIGAVMLVQIAFWLLFTHLKSRFLLPAIVPCAVGAAIGVRWMVDRSDADWGAGRRCTVIAAALLAWSIAPVIVFATERGGAPAAAIGQADTMTGKSIDPSMRRELGMTAMPTVAVNYLLQDDAKVLLIGEAKPLYYRTDRIVYQTTWDRGPMSSIMRQSPHDPARWLAALREQGFTHLLVDDTMLRIWERSSWNDPMLTHDHIMSFARQHAKLIAGYPNDVALYELEQ